MSFLSKHAGATENTHKGQSRDQEGAQQISGNRLAIPMQED